MKELINFKDRPGSDFYIIIPLVLLNFVLMLSVAWLECTESGDYANFAIILLAMTAVVAMFWKMKTIIDEDDEDDVF